MKKYNKHQIAIVTAVVVVIVFSFTKLIVTRAATTPSLGVAETYGVLAGTYTNTTVTTIHGDVGYTIAPATPPTVIGGTIYGSGAPTPAARTDAANALTDLNNQACTFNFAAGAIDLATDTTHGSLGVYTPGVYCTTGAGAASIGTNGITLSGAGTYIFRINGALTSVDSSNVVLNAGASASDVFWTPIAATTLGANTTFKGTVIDNANAITVGANTAWIGRALSLGAGTVTTDTDTITVPVTLRVIKTVVNDNGGTAVSSNFTTHVKLSGTDVAGSPAAGAASPGTAYSLVAGTYVVSEDAFAGYTTTFSGDCNSSGSVTLTAGQDKTCTITNNDIAPQLTVTKTVINDNGGIKVIADFPLFIDGGSVTSGAVSTTSAGLHTVSETSNAGYTATFGGDCAADGTITLALGDVKTCTITNDDIAPPPPASATLRVIKTVVNNNGGTAVASDFTIDVAGTNVSSSSFPGSEAGVNVTLDAGSYAVTETSLSGYLQSGSGDCSGTIASGETKTCTITNDDIAPQLIVSKVVINDNGGTKVVSDFPLFIDGGSVTSGVANTSTIGSHTVSETTDSGYTATIGGNCAADGTITLALGDVKTCTITNNDIAPSGGGDGGDGGGGGGGGGSYTPPVPPLIEIVKVPSPLALPDGPGQVEYTYTLRNIGTVPVSNITMVGDTCSPIVRISGDTNGDNRLDVNETWVYTCSTTLSKTHTNIITATGWANGISATDIANATVTVGIPVVPPLIHVTKVPNPLVLSAGEGMVTYTNKVTNPGTEPLSNVQLTDDKCSPVNYISGDANDDSKLDTTETWTYTCQTKLTETTVNTITASGEANGLITRDYAIATVVVNPVAPTPNVIVPKLPNTGLHTDEKNIPWYGIMPAGILGIFILFHFARRKQTS